jgi:hypothetical protein
MSGSDFGLYGGSALAIYYAHDRGLANMLTDRIP